MQSLSFHEKYILIEIAKELKNYELAYSICNNTVEKLKINNDDCHNLLIIYFSLQLAFCYEKLGEF